MKSTKVVKIISLIFISFVVLFGPTFYIQKTYISCAFVVFCNNFSWFTILLLISFICFVLALFFELFSKRKSCYWITEIILSFFSLIVFSFSSEFYNKNYSLNCQLSFISYFVIISSILLILKSLSKLFDENKFNVGDIVEIGIFVSLAVVLDLSFFKVKIGANGGSISLSMLPLFIIAVRKGFFKGFVASGIIYGLITCLTDNYGFITYPFDYLLGFGSIAVISLFKNLFFPKEYKFSLKGLLFLIIGFWLSIIFRFIFATMSGVIIYKLNIGASMLYQLGYLGPSSGIVFAALLILYKPLLLINKRYSYSNK